MVMPQAGLGTILASQPLQPSNLTYQEPKRFSTSFNTNIPAGTVTYSLEFTGCEE